MLGRTAQNMFWLSRYVERAENMARLLEVGYRMSLTSRREGGASEHLVSMMQAAEVDEAFFEKHKIADVGTVSSVVRTPLGVHILAVCGRRLGGPEAPSAQQVEARLQNQNYAMLGRRYLRDLRADALIEIKQ